MKNERKEEIRQEDRKWSWKFALIIVASLFVGALAGAGMGLLEGIDSRLLDWLSGCAAPLGALGVLWLTLIAAVVTALVNCRQAKALAQEGQVTIRIGSFASISHTWLPKVLRDYQKAHPGTTFDIRIGTDKLPRWLLEDQIDLALGDAHRCQSFQWYPLMDDPYYAVLPEGLITDGRTSITQEAFAQYTLIMAPMNALDAHLTVLSDRRINVSSDDDSTILSIVAQGLGVTAMPLLSLRNTLEDLQTMKLEPVPKRVLGVALPKSPTPAAVSFAAFLRKQFAYAP